MTEEEGAAVSVCMYVCMHACMYVQWIPRTIGRAKYLSRIGFSKGCSVLVVWLTFTYIVFIHVLIYLLMTFYGVLLSLVYRVLSRRRRKTQKIMRT